MNTRRYGRFYLRSALCLAQWLYRYWQNAAPERIESIGEGIGPMMAHCVAGALTRDRRGLRGGTRLVQHKARIPMCCGPRRAVSRLHPDALRVSRPIRCVLRDLGWGAIARVETHGERKIVGAIPLADLYRPHPRHVDQRVCRYVLAQGAAFHDEMLAYDYARLRLELR